MLPHMSFLVSVRHGSSDRIVELLVTAFPDSVHVKGKHDRTPLDCAIRANDAVRGRMLNSFAQRINDTMAVVSDRSKEINKLKKELEEKESELGAYWLKMLLITSRPKTSVSSSNMLVF